VTRRAIALILALLAVGLVTLAHVAPVDPTWIGGLYDNGDGDDSVLAARSVVAEALWSPVPTPPLIVTLPLVVVSDVVAAPRPDRAFTLQGRAPPLS
jgi:hypothetical protein